MKSIQHVDEYEFADRINVVRDALEARAQTIASKPENVVCVINDSTRLTPVNGGKGHVLSIFGHVVSDFGQDDFAFVYNEPCA